MGAVKSSGNAYKSREVIVPFPGWCPTSVSCERRVQSVILRLR